MNPATINTLLANLQCSFRDRKQSDSKVFLALPPSLGRGAVKSAGPEVEAIALKVRHPTVYVTATPDFVAYLNENMVYPCKLETVWENYFLELLPNNKLLCKYQSIIGSRTLGTLTDEDVVALERRIIGVFQETASEEILKLGLTVETKAPTLESELMLLTADMSKIYLPSVTLVNYAPIKAMLQKAGGTYSKDSFCFEAGVDAADVLNSLQKGQEVNPKKKFQFFATPQVLAQEICAAVGSLNGKRVLEPSAGDGVLADIATAAGAKVICVETWDVNVIKLRAKNHTTIQADFLEVSPTEWAPFDAIIANPPFTKNQDIDHVLHMLRFLKPGGILSTIMSAAWVEGKQVKHVAFSDFIAQNGLVSVVDIPAGTFAESGTQVSAVHVVIRKPDTTASHENLLAEMSET